MKLKKSIPIVLSIMTASILAPIMVSCNNAEQIKQEATINIVSEHGKVTLSVEGEELTGANNKIALGKSVHVIVTPNDGYAVSNIVLDGKIISQTSIADFEVSKTGDLTLNVNYETIDNTAKVTIENNDHGSINVINEGIDLDNVPYGTIIKLAVTPNEGYEFDKIIVNNEELEKGKLEFECKSGTTLFVVKAIFVSKGITPEPEPEPEPDPIKKASITIQSSDGGIVEVSDKTLDLTNVPINTRINLDVTPEKGYELKELLVNGSSIKDTRYFDVKETINYTIKATFVYKAEETITKATITFNNITGTNSELTLPLEDIVSTNVKVTDVNYTKCYNEDGFIRVSSGKGDGSFSLRLDKKYKIKKVSIEGKPYNTDTPIVFVNLGGTIKENVVKVGETVFEFDQLVETDTVTLSSKQKNRFLFNQITLELVDGNGGGTVDPTPDPEKEYASLRLPNSQNGLVEVLNEGLDLNNIALGTEIKLKATPNKGYKLGSILVNNKDISDTLSFVVDKKIEYIVTATFIKDEPSVATNATIDIINIKGSNGSQLNATYDNFAGTNVKVIDATHTNCFAEDGKIRFSSGKKSGSLTLTLDNEYKISSIKLFGKKYSTDNPKVSINVGTGTFTRDFSNETIYELGEPITTNSFTISSASNNRFILEKIELQFGEGTGGGTVDPTPDPGNKEANVVVNKTGNGTVTLEKSQGFEGEIVKATIIPGSNSYISTIEFNGNYCWLDSGKDYASLKLIAGENTLNVVFKEKGSSEGGRFVALYGNDRIKPTRGSQGSYDAYYEPVRGLKGPALKAGLNQIIKGHKTFGYKTLNETMLVTDVDPFDSSKIVFTYEGSLKRGTAFNKEHTWAKSVGNFGTSAGPGSDMHHLRPSNQNLNTIRSNFDFAEVEGGKDCGTAYSWSRPTMKGNYVGGSKFEPKDEFKGDVARMIFYMATRYEGGDGYVDLEVGSSKGKIDGINHDKYYTFGTAPGLHGSFDDLYRWATTPLDPVSDFEVNRNNIIDEKYQHNRNPFIDHPEFIQMIYDKNYDGPGALNDK